MFRSLGKSKIAFILAILFGLSLFFFRGGDRYSNLLNSDNVVASVSGTPISTSKFLRVLELNVDQYNQMFGRPLTSEEINAFQIHSISLGNLINNAVFENEFDSQKFIIDEKVVASETKRRLPNLYDDNNKLNEIALNSFLSQQNLKIDDLVKIIDYETRSTLFDKLFFQVNYPNEIKTIISKHDRQKRNANLVKINIENYTLSNFNSLDISLDNSDIQNYFSENLQSYIDPEKRDISYIIINKDDYINQFTPSDSEITNYYNNNTSLFLESEKRDFVQFNFKEKNDAEKFKKNIASLSKEEIINYAKDNEIFFNEFKKVSKDEVLEELSKKIFSLQINEISSVIETALAKHIVIVNNVYPQTQNSLEKSKNEISETLLQVELDSFFSDLKININQQILDGFSISEIANKNSLIIKNIIKAERQNNSPENDLIINEVIAKAFDTSKDFVSDIKDIDNNRSILVNVDNIENEKPFELSQIFEIVSKDWIKSLKIKEINKFVENINLNSKSLEEIAKFVGSEILNSDIAINNSDYPSIFTNNLFKSKLKDISISEVGDDIYISKVIDITFPNEIENNVEKLSMISELRSKFGAEIIKTKKISTNDNLIQAILNQY